MPPERLKSDRLGIDDWAWRKGQRYSVPAVLSRCGPLLVDLVSHRPVDVLADRTAETVTAWLRSHPGVELYVPHLQTRWETGCHNAKQLWREIREKGYAGSQRMVMLWAQVRRDPEERHAGRPRFNQPLPSDTRQTLDLPAASQLGWLLVCQPEKLDAEQQPLLAHIRQHPAVAAAYELAQQCTSLVRERRAAVLERWLGQSHASSITELRQFASGLQKDYAAVRAALTLPWSSGPVEGNATRLKLIRRHMYGRAHLDLLRIRVLGET